MTLRDFPDPSVILTVWKRVIPDWRCERMVTDYMNDRISPHPVPLLMTLNPENQAGQREMYDELASGESTLRRQTPAHLAVERAIRDLKTPPPTHRRAMVMDGPPQVTVTSVLRKFADLRIAVGALSQFLRSEGVPPERMLPQVKTIVRDVIASEGWKDRGVEQLVVENVVRWAIDAYYEV